MAGSEAVLEQMRGWLAEWKAANNPSGELLGGERLERFVREYQDEIARVVDFGKNEIGENARLVLHSGIDYLEVEGFCKGSGGEYYMISQTESAALWNGTLQEAISRAIGDSNEERQLTIRLLTGKARVAEAPGPARVSRYAIDGSDLLAPDDFISERVAKAGMEKGGVVFIVGDNISGCAVALQTEIPAVFNQCLEKGLDVSAVSFKRLMVISNRVWELAEIDVSDAAVHLDADGRVVYVDVPNSAALEFLSLSESCRSALGAADGAVFRTDVGRMSRYAGDDAMVARYGKDFSELAPLERIRLKEFDLRLSDVGIGHLALRGGPILNPRVGSLDEDVLSFDREGGRTAARLAGGEQEESA